MKNRLLLISAALMILVNSHAGEPVKPETKANTASPVVYLTNETFKQKVFNYEVNKEWKYAGNKPAIIDFYADWCGPCRKVSPIIEELAREYNGKIIVYKVDTEKEKVLSQNLGIQSLPTILFIPAQGDPQAIMGALPKEELKKAIQEILLVK
jgi:thioredoxin